MSEETAVRIADALERIALVLASFMSDAPPAEEPEEVFQTQEGPMVLRAGRLVPLISDDTVPASHEPAASPLV